MDSPKGDCGRGEFGWVVGGRLQQNSPGSSSLQSLHLWEDNCASLSSWLSRGWAALKIPRACVHIHIHTETHKHTLSSIQTTGTKTAENTRQEQKSSIFKDNPSIFNVHLPQWNPAFSDEQSTLVPPIHPSTSKPYLNLYVLQETIPSKSSYCNRAHWPLWSYLTIQRPHQTIASIDCFSLS